MGDLLSACAHERMDFWLPFLFPLFIYIHIEVEQEKKSGLKLLTQF